MRLFLFAGGLLLSLLLSRAAGAQVPLRLWADSVSAVPGDTVSVPVRAHGFSQMLTCQGTLAFDSTIVEAVGGEPGVLPGLSAANFGQSGRSYLTFAWYDPSVSGQSVADSAVLFSIRFRVLGSIGQRSSVQLTNSPTVIECVRVGFQPVVPAWRPGDVVVGPPLAVAQTVSKALAFTFFPNPACDWLALPESRTVVALEVATGHIRLALASPDGRLDLRAWPAGFYLLRPADQPRSPARRLLVVR